MTTRGRFRPGDHFGAQVLDITERLGTEPVAVSPAVQPARGRGDGQRRLAAIGHLASGVAHDFNNIVSTIGVYAELIGRQQHLDADGRQHLDTIRQQLERATALVSQILDFVHDRPMERVQVDLATFLAQLVPVLRQTLPEGIAVTLRHDGGSYVIWGDPVRLQQIFLNLATNARDAMPGAGELSFTLSSEWGRNRAGPDRWQEDTNRLWVRLDVADTGRGIPPHVLARAFEPFFTTKPAGHGTGLGLTQVHSLVSAHDGHLEIDGAADRGTTVRIWLPLASASVDDVHATGAHVSRIQHSACS